MQRRGAHRFGEATPVRAVDVVVSWPQYATNPFEFRIAHGVRAGGGGGIFAHDLTGDGLLDFVVTAPGHVSAYDHDGALLWHQPSRIHLPDNADGGVGYPGRHAPGAVAGDVDGDGDSELVYVTEAGTVDIRDGASGTLERSWPLPGAQALALANLRELGDREAVVQFNQTHIAAIDLATGTTLWDQPNWFGVEHSQVRVVDVDGDGSDEVVGGVIVDGDGSVLSGWDLALDHGIVLSGLDSLAIGDIVPGGPLEIALAETGSHTPPFANNYTIVVTHKEVLWKQRRDPGSIPDTGACKREKDPDKVAVGNFDPGRAGLEVFARSACGRHPWIHSSDGELVASWDVSDTAPAGWYLGGPPVADSEGGIDIAVAIDWHGDGHHRLLVTERHIAGDVAVVDAMTGSFERVFAAAAARIHAVDVAGDHREEIVVIEGDENAAVVRIIANDGPSGAIAVRRWRRPEYRRTKQVWNYYSP
jgi:hypothetical protein